MRVTWFICGLVAFAALEASASECCLGGWNLLPAGLSCGSPKTTCCTSYPSQCGCDLPKTTCCSTYPSSCGCEAPKTTCCTSYPSCGCQRSSCCNSYPSCGSGYPNCDLQSCNFPFSVLPCNYQSCGCQPAIPKTTTCTTIPFGNPICGKTTTCTTYPNPCGKSTTTCTTVPHANPACAKTTTCQTLPLDPCFQCNQCYPTCGKACCCSQAIPGKCSNPLCKCGFCQCQSPCQCGLF